MLRTEVGRNGDGMRSTQRDHGLRTTLLRSLRSYGGRADDGVDAARWIPCGPSSVVHRLEYGGRAIVHFDPASTRSAASDRSLATQAMRSRVS